MCYFICSTYQFQPNIGYKHLIFLVLEKKSYRFKFIMYMVQYKCKELWKMKQMECEKLSAKGEKIVAYIFIIRTK